MKFCKMNGLGNDFVLVYLPDNPLLPKENVSELTKRLSDRRFGVGADGLVLIDKSELADFSMRIINADGSEAAMCGNALRCVAKYLYDRALVKGNNLQIATLSGVRRAEVKNDGVVRAELGMPSLIMQKHGATRVVNEVSIGGKSLEVTYVDVGNSHAVRFVRSLSNGEFATAKRISESYGDDGINAEIVRVKDRNNIELRVYERGVGETFACGTGAAAAVFAGYLRGYVADKVCVTLKGGTLQTEYIGGRIYISGEVRENFEGIIT